MKKNSLGEISFYKNLFIDLWLFPRSRMARRASLVAQTVMNLPAMRKTWVWSLGWEDPLEEGMATHSSILAWRIPGTEEPGELKNWIQLSNTHTHTHTHTHTCLSCHCSSRLPARLLCPWDFPSKNTEWVAMPSSRGFSPPRDRARLQCRPGLQFTQW